MNDLTLLGILVLSVTGVVETVKRFFDYTGLFADKSDLRKIALFIIAMVGGLVTSFTTVNAESFLPTAFSTLDPSILKVLAGFAIGYFSIYPHRLQQWMRMQGKEYEITAIEGVVSETEAK